MISVLSWPNTPTLFSLYTTLSPLSDLSFNRLAHLPRGEELSGLTRLLAGNQEPRGPLPPHLLPRFRYCWLGDRLLSEAIWSIGLLGSWSTQKRETLWTYIKAILDIIYKINVWTITIKAGEEHGVNSVVGLGHRSYYCPYTIPVRLCVRQGFWCLNLPGHCFGSQNSRDATALPVLCAALCQAWEALSHGPLQERERYA